MSEADNNTVVSGEIVTERAQPPASLVQKQSPSDGNAAADLRMDEIAGMNEAASSTFSINEPSQPAAPPKKLLATIKIPSMFATSACSNIAPSIGTGNSSTSSEATPSADVAAEKSVEPKASSPHQAEPFPEACSPAAPMMVLPGPSSAPAVPATQAPGPIFPGPPQPHAANQNRPASGSVAHPQLNDALAYLDRVKAEFHDQPEVYNKFLQIMRDFKVNAYAHPVIDIVLMF